MLIDEFKGDGAGGVVRCKQTYADHDKCLISLLNQKANQLSLHFRRVWISADFAWLPGLGWKREAQGKWWFSSPASQ